MLGIGFSPRETVIVVLSLAVALASVFLLWRVSRQEDRRARLAALQAAVVERTVQEQRRSWYTRLGSFVAASSAVGPAEQQRLLGLLAASGIREHVSLAGFVASKVCSAFIAAALLWLLVEWRQWFADMMIIRIAALFGALLIGWRLPDLVLSRLAARRQLQLEQGLPDALDLLVICAEAGLSLDQSIEQVSGDLRGSNAAVAEEFATTAAEMRVLTNRGEALENLMRRTGVGSLRSITATLNQAIRFGTPLAESMRILSAEMRDARMARIEERAARLPVLLTLPMALFILPCLFLIIGTPVVLNVIDSFKNATIGAP
jgi:tight adherence protein C